MGYNYKGLELPSVTQITGQLDKPALVPWAAKMTSAYLQQQLEGLELDHIDRDIVIGLLREAPKNFRKFAYRAAGIGNTVHDAIHLYLTEGIEPSAPTNAHRQPEVERAWGAFMSWLDDNEATTLAAELPVMSKGYAGTVDWIVRLHGDATYIVDFKTSTGVYDEMRYQIAAYRQAAPRKYKVEGCGILRLDKETGVPEFVNTSDTYKQDVRVFNALCRVWWERHPTDYALFKAMGGKLHGL